MSEPHLTNDELASIYDYLRGTITQTQLTRELKRARTNTYYYVGRAVHYWVGNGTLRFYGIHKAEDLGGSDVDQEDTEEEN